MYFETKSRNATSVHLPINRVLIDDQPEKYGEEIPEQKNLYSS